MEITPEVQELLDKQKAELTAAFNAETDGLVKAKNDLLAEKKLAQEAEAAAKTIAENEALDKAKANKDVDTLTLSYEEKLQGLTAQLNELNTKNLNAAKSQLANDFVNEHVVNDAFSRQAMAEAYKGRIDIRDGKTVVLDPQGNLTALSVEDLNKEFISASIYGNHIVGTKATGGGAEGNKGGGRAVSLKDMTATQEAAFANANPEAYKQLIGN